MNPAHPKLSLQQREALRKVAVMANEHLHFLLGMHGLAGEQPTGQEGDKAAMQAYVDDICQHFDFRAALQAVVDTANPNDGITPVPPVEINSAAPASTNSETSYISRSATPTECGAAESFENGCNPLEFDAMQYATQRSPGQNSAEFVELSLPEFGQPKVETSSRDKQHISLEEAARDKHESAAERLAARDSPVWPTQANVLPSATAIESQHLTVLSRAEIPAQAAAKAVRQYAIRSRRLCHPEFCNAHYEPQFPFEGRRVSHPGQPVPVVVLDDNVPQALGAGELGMDFKFIE